MSATSHAMMESEATLALARWSSSLPLIRAIAVEGGDSTQLTWVEKRARGWPVLVLSQEAWQREGGKVAVAGGGCGVKGVSP